MIILVQYKMENKEMTQLYMFTKGKQEGSNTPTFSVSVGLGQLVHASVII